MLMVIASLMLVKIYDQNGGDGGIAVAAVVAVAVVVVTFASVTLASLLPSLV